MLPRPHTHAGCDTAEDGRVGVHGVSEGEEQPDDIRQVREPEVQVWKQAVLVQRVLRGYCGAKQGRDREVHKEPADGGSDVGAA